MRAAAGLALLAAAIVLAVAAHAQQLVADLSSHLVAISTGFTGTEVVLFGSTEGPGDVAVVVTGPRAPITVRRKHRSGGIWINRSWAVFPQAPSFYGVATNRPLDAFTDPALLERHQIGLSHLRLEPQQPMPTPMLADFREALIRNKQRQGLYGSSIGPVTFLGERLFRTTLYFPANVPTGLYNVGVFLIRNGEVVSAQTTPLVVSKVGFSAELSEFARGQPALYALIAIMGALAGGWIAAASFRNV